MMSAKTPVSTTELQAHLDEQLRFLERSADAFDRGFEDEGKRLAVAIRILVHDTNLSHSLLGQVGMKTQPFIDTSLPFDPKNVASHHGLISIRLGGGGAKYVPHLDSGFPARRIPFDQWWNEPVIVDGKRRQFSRKDLVLTAANQDGGAHVDPSLDNAYAELSRRNSLNWFAGTLRDVQPLSFPERASIRQITNSL